jgi:hypothetical protein
MTFIQLSIIKKKNIEKITKRKIYESIGNINLNKFKFTKPTQQKQLKIIILEISTRTML